MESDGRSAFGRKDAERHQLPDQCDIHTQQIYLDRR